MEAINIPLSRVPRGRAAAGPLSARPAAEIVGQLYLATDQGDFGVLYCAYAIGNFWFALNVAQYTATGPESGLPAEPVQAGDRYFTDDTFREFVAIDDETWVNISKGYGAFKGILTVTDENGLLNALNAGANGSVLIPDSSEDLGVKYGDMGDVAFVPADDDDWDPPPSNMQQVADQLAFRIQVVEDAGGSAGTLGGWRLRNSADLSGPLTQLTETDIAWNTEDYDTNTFHDTVTANNRVTIPSSYGGLYLTTISAFFLLEDSFGGAITGMLRLYKNTNFQCEASYQTPVSVGNVGITVTLITTIALVPTDYLNVKYYVDGDNCGILFTSGKSWWSGERLR